MTHYFTAKKITFVALFTALTVALSSFGVPVPGGHLYLCDIIICFAALVLDPFSAFIVGGVGSFLGDLFFYPAPMFVSLITHGIQSVVISLIAGSKDKDPQIFLSILAVFVGAIIMVVGYTLGKIYVYSTYEYAMIKLPYEILQAAVGAVAAIVLLFASPLRKFINTIPKK
ncbi:MAG: ECF transporter S component [Clostridia bacterium]|nr:ECF transporter S component [Clostridia bacterium]